VWADLVALVGLVGLPSLIEVCVLLGLVSLTRPTSATQRRPRPATTWRRARLVVREFLGLDPVYGGSGHSGERVPTVSSASFKNAPHPRAANRIATAIFPLIPQRNPHGTARRSMRHEKET